MLCKVDLQCSLSNVFGFDMIARQGHNLVSFRHLQANILTVLRQASAKWRIMWRLAPWLLEHWSETGRLDAINAAVTAAVKKVRRPLGTEYFRYPAVQRLSS